MAFMSLPYPDTTQVLTHFKMVPWILFCYDFVAHFCYTFIE